MDSQSERITRLAGEERSQHALARETLGLTVAASEVLRRLAMVPESRSVSDLRSSTGLSRCQATDAVRALEDRGWIVAWVPDDDRRRLATRISAKGRDAYLFLQSKTGAAGDRDLSKWMAFVRGVTERCGVSVTEARVLLLMGERASVSVGMVSRELELPQSSSSVALDALARTGLVVAEAGRDRRSRDWVLTESGGRLLEVIVRMVPE